MIEFPDLTRQLASVLGIDKVAATVAVRLAHRPERTHKTAEAAYQTLAAALRVDDDRACSVLITVESVLSQVEQLKFSDANSLFRYSGALDGNIRPFCLEHVGKVYTLEQIDGLDNGQLSDVLLTRGGWECRHKWIEISRFSESAPLAGTNQRIPETVEAVTCVTAFLAATPQFRSDRPPWSRWPNCPGPLRG